MLRRSPLAALAAAIASGVLACPVFAEDTPAGNPLTDPAPAAAESPASRPAAVKEATPAPTGDARDREIAELRKIFEELRSRLAESDSLKQVIEQLMKRIDALEQSRPSEPAGAPPAGRSGAATLLPNISVIGNLTLGAGDTRRVPNRGRFNFTELEIAFQDAVSPKLRYDVFINATKEEDWGVGMEEGYLTWSSLGKGLNARIGRLRTPFGKFNSRHPHQWVFITQPSAQGALMGPEGLNSDGAVVDYTFPTKGFFARAELGAWQTASDAEDGLGFGAGDSGAYSGRLWLGKELGPDREVELGFSRYQGNGDVDGFGRRKRSLTGVDLTYRGYPSALRRVLVSAEVINHQTRLLGDSKNSLGGFAYAAYKWDRYWEAGVRGDYTRFPFPVDSTDWGGSVFLTKYVTEQTSLRLEYQYTNSPLQGTGSGIYFQILFGSGPHVHQFQ